MIISPQILHTLIEEIHHRDSPELAVQAEELLPESYREYILNVINSNREDGYFCPPDFQEHPITVRQLYQIAERQMKKLDIEAERCFERVSLLEKKGELLKIDCSEPFWIACQDSEAVFLYQYADGMEEQIVVEVGLKEVKSKRLEQRIYETNINDC